MMTNRQTASSSLLKVTPQQLILLGNFYLARKRKRVKRSLFPSLPRCIVSFRSRLVELQWNKQFDCFIADGQIGIQAIFVRDCHRTQGPDAHVDRCSEAAMPNCVEADQKNSRTTNHGSYNCSFSAREATEFASRFRAVDS